MSPQPEFYLVEPNRDGNGHMPWDYLATVELLGADIEDGHEASNQGVDALLRDSAVPDAGRTRVCRVGLIVSREF